MFSTTSLTQGPRGLPGERGRPGPSGVAVSVVFIDITLLYSTVGCYS